MQGSDLCLGQRPGTCRKTYCFPHAPYAANHGHLIRDSSSPIITEYYRLSHDVVACDADRDVSTAYC